MMSKDTFKQILPSLLENDSYQIESTEDEKGLLPFLINKSLSANIDTIFLSNEMNRRHFLDNKLQYDFLFHSVRKYKRKYQKWLKYDETKNVEVIKCYYNCSTQKAEEYINILTEDQIKCISEKLDKGG
jgi:hypothetical protein